jgi:hypothetical protein
MNIREIALPFTLSECVLINGMRACRNQIQADYGSSDAAWLRCVDLAKQINNLGKGIPNSDFVWALGALLQSHLRYALDVSQDAE